MLALPPSMTVAGAVAAVTVRSTAGAVSVIGIARLLFVSSVSGWELKRSVAKIRKRLPVVVFGIVGVRLTVYIALAVNVCDSKTESICVSLLSSTWSSDR